MALNLLMHTLATNQHILGSPRMLASPLEIEHRLLSVNLYKSIKISRQPRTLECQLLSIDDDLLDSSSRFTATFPFGTATTPSAFTFLVFLFGMLTASMISLSISRPEVPEKILRRPLHGTVIALSFHWNFNKEMMRELSRNARARSPICRRKSIVPKKLEEVPMKLRKSLLVGPERMADEDDALVEKALIRIRRAQKRRKAAEMRQDELAALER